VLFHGRHRVAVFLGASPGGPSGSGKSSSLGLLVGVLGGDQAGTGGDGGDGRGDVEVGGRIVVERGGESAANGDEDGTDTGERGLEVFHFLMAL